MFLLINRDSCEPIYFQIVSALRGMISTEALRAGEQLPSSRDLSRQLGVSRMTVDRAYGLLQADGVIYSDVGRGTFVAASSSPSTARQAHKIEKTDQYRDSGFWESLLSYRYEEEPSMQAYTVVGKKVPYSFVTAISDPALFPLKSFRRCIDSLLTRNRFELSDQGDRCGNFSLREYIACQMRRRGITCSPNEILITTGCRHALDLIAQLLVRDKGDSVILENPTHVGAIHTLSLRTEFLLELPVSPIGVDFRELERALENKTPRLIYLVPTFHNPTGALMREDDRRRLLGILHHKGIPVVEDDIFGELYFEGQVEPSLKALDKSGLVIYINSFSKMLSPGIRVGWIVAPRIVIEQLSYLQEATDYLSNGILQAALAKFCKRGVFVRHLKRIARVSKIRRDALLNAVERFFPAGSHSTVPKGGLSVWVTLPPEFDTVNLYPEALSRGVAFIPGASFYFRNPVPNTLRLSFGTMEPTAIREGIRLLGKLLNEKRSSRFREKPFDHSHSTSNIQPLPHDMLR